MPSSLPSPQSFTSLYNGIVDVLITHVWISEAFDLTRNNPPPTKVFTAIWDTGATKCAITKRVVSELGLKPISVAEIHTASGTHKCLVYLVGILLPNHIGFASLRVTEVELIGNADVLIGMDLICQGDFAITNMDGKTKFSFRFPSTASFDFVEEAKTPAQTVNPLPRVGRNEPCPCGSGKKYKHCHMRKP